MTIRSTTAVAAAGLLFGLLSPASAQPPGVAGRWSLNIDKSDHAAVTPVLPSTTLDIRQDGPALTITTLVTTPGGVETTRWKCTTDRKACVNAGAHFKDLESTAWFERGRLFVRGEREGISIQMNGDNEEQGREYFRYGCVDEYAVSDNGKTLTVSRTLTSPDGERRMTLVFERQARRTAAQATTAQWTQAIVELCKALRARYVLLDLAERAAQAIEKLLAGGRYAMSDAREFADAVTEDLQRVTSDRHLRFGVAEPVVPAQTDVATEREAARAAVRRGNNGFARVEILPGNVGYLDLRRFVSPDTGGETLVGAMAFLANADGVIVDLRNCTGGAASMVPYFAAYFFARPTSLFDMEFRGDNVTEHFWTLAWVPGRRLADVPMYILTSARTFSGAEGLAYRFQVLKRATIVGERTGGGANAGGVLDIPPLFRVWMPMGRPVDQQTRGNWDGVGVSPDVEVPAREALPAAWRRALAALRAAAATDMDRTRLDWAIERAESAAHPVDPSTADLERLAGTYGSARVWVEGGQLRFCRETEQTVLLVPLTATTFATDVSDPLRFEFVGGPDGTPERLVVTAFDFTRTTMLRRR